MNEKDGDGNKTRYVEPSKEFRLIAGIQGHQVLGPTLQQMFVDRDSGGYAYWNTVPTVWLKPDEYHAKLTGVDRT